MGLSTLSIPREGISAFAGILFGVAWLLSIDGHVHQGRFHYEPSVKTWYYVPGIVATLALLMQNLVNLDSLNPSSWLFDDSVSSRVRAWLFISFVLSIGAIVASVWLMVAIFLPAAPDSQWPGIAMVLQSSIIFMSGTTIGIAMLSRQRYNYNLDGLLRTAVGWAVVAIYSST